VSDSGHRDLDFDPVFRQEHGRVVATLIRLFGDIDLAEEAAQEAFVIALQRRPHSGMPPNPGGWLTTTARNRAIDRIRRESTRDLRHAQAAMLANHGGKDPSFLQDDRLRLLFTCCHPALATDAQVALTLRLLGGLTTGEIAPGFLVPEATMTKRLTRAKQKIMANRIPYRVPGDAELPNRLPGVLGTLYLVFNEGYLSSAGQTATRVDLCIEAIRLARILASLMPDEPEAQGLLALMLLTDARRCRPRLRRSARAPVGAGPYEVGPRAHRRRPLHRASLPAPGPSRPLPASRRHQRGPHRGGHLR
jgi:RNA polymerase sigma-70 factor (ECF subfamily)